MGDRARVSTVVLAPTVDSLSENKLYSRVQAHGQENISNAKKCPVFLGNSRQQQTRPRFLRYGWVSKSPRVLGARKQQTEGLVFPIVMITARYSGSKQRYHKRWHDPPPKVSSQYEVTDKSEVKFNSPLVVRRQKICVVRVYFKLNIFATSMGQTHRFACVGEWLDGI
ncbi:hypothetical protein TWF225_012095 [Orbilia oligospora]|uniref:Uncharacterized protein n=1 Tax=Orbilia oligospora TaxID=2813651 RepID=A0A8H2ECV8_ORBOL|nr:hypothetical protein TWF225_012095 [Orbilia oligospora]KAF3242944.1 hypothetical protein TWF128_012102 [Orbilia oligospora]KAF3260385.1 hypothetical protein TWF217_012081 [Orbilia oligospora]KAF3278714.1 hypothetical protein TWF132_012086 [Orbilia oligospora]TGJ74466.1 hypothetical protein EYR41_001471 [Orbilia oligospora]